MTENFKYLPFGGGRRKCIGDQFALFETIVTLAMLLRRYDFELALGKPEVGMTTGERCSGLCAGAVVWGALAALGPRPAQLLRVQAWSAGPVRLVRAMSGVLLRGILLGATTRRAARCVLCSVIRAYHLFMPCHLALPACYMAYAQTCLVHLHNPERFSFSL